jgi:hypothetical protein
LLVFLDLRRVADVARRVLRHPGGRNGCGGGEGGSRAFARGVSC